MIGTVLAALLGAALLLLGDRIAPRVHAAIPIAVGALSLSWALLRFARWLLGYGKSPDGK